MNEKEVEKIKNYINMYIDFYCGYYGSDKIMNFEELKEYIIKQINKLKD